MNEVKYEHIEGLVEVKNNGQKYIGMKDDSLIPVDKNYLLSKLSISSFAPFSINSCSKELFKMGGIKIESNKIIIDTEDLHIVKTLDLFEEGNNKGCKDESYGKWIQPILHSNNSESGTCYASSEELPAYFAMNGIFDSSEDGWLSSTNKGIWSYTNKTPFIVDYLILANRYTNISKNIQIFNNEQFIMDYKCSEEPLEKNYVPYPYEKRNEIQNITIKIQDGYNTKIGFNEIVINARTKYIQPNTEYNLFLIYGEEKTDVLVSLNENPILPNGFTKYELVGKIHTQPNNIDLIENFGNGLTLNLDQDLIITNCMGETTYITNKDKIGLITFDKKSHYYICIGKNKELYAIDCKYYKNEETFPTPEDNLIVSIPDEYGLNVYQYQNNVWKIFEDVILGELVFDNFITELHQYPCNNNYYHKCIDNNVLIFESALLKNRTLEIKHNLNNDSLTSYNFDCLIVCTSNDQGYIVNDIAMNPMIDNKALQVYMTKTSICVDFGNDIKTYNKNGEIITLDKNKWKVVFRIYK